MRPAAPSQAALLSDLALRSKGSWGYDAAFLSACRDELTIHPEQCDGVHVVVAERGGLIAGFYRLDEQPPTAELADLFVDPARAGRGVGRQLLHHALEQARLLGFKRLTIEADPHAEAFYLRAGATRTGTVPSGSIAGRLLPRLELAVPAPP